MTDFGEPADEVEVPGEPIETDGRRRRLRFHQRDGYMRTRTLIVELRSLHGVMLAACLALCIPPSSIAPGPGVDLSWVTALNVAHGAGLRFGRDLLFTYGPWGYLDAPLATSRLELVTGLIFAAISLTIAWLALRMALAPVVPPLVAAIAASVTLVIATPSGGASAVLVLGITLGLIDYVGSADLDRMRAWLPRWSALAAGLLVELKFSEGLFLTLIVFVACIFGPRRRLLRTVEAAVIYVVTLVLAWVVAGQPLHYLPRFLSKSVEISRAYSDAMATDYKPNLFGYILIIATILLIIGYVVRLPRGFGFRRTVGVFLLSALVGYLGFREATGRHDAGHEVYFYLWALPSLAWFIAMAKSRTFRATIFVIAVVLASNNFLNTSPNVVRSRWATATQVALDGSYQRFFLTQAQGNAQVKYDVPYSMRLTVAGHPVAIDGAEDSVAWAYGFAWRPAPVFQSYAAFTADLDSINAQWLRDAPSSQMILRPPVTAIDFRNSLWDPPRYVLAEMCNTSVLSSSAKWMLLQKSTNRCGAASSVSHAHVNAGQTVRVPSVGPSQILTMSFDPDPAGLLTRLGRIVNKSFTPIEVHTDTTAYRLPTQLASGPLVMNVPSELGWPTAFTGDAPYHHLYLSQSGTVTFNVINVS